MPGSWCRYGSDAGFDLYDLDGDGFIDPDEAPHLQYLGGSNSHLQYIVSKITHLQAAGQIPKRVVTYKVVTNDPRSALTSHRQVPSGGWSAYALLITSCKTFSLVWTKSSGKPGEVPMRTCFEGTFDTMGDLEVMFLLLLPLFVYC